MECVGIGPRAVTAGRSTHRPWPSHAAPRSPGNPLAALERWLGEGIAEPARPVAPVWQGSSTQGFEASVADFRSRAGAEGWTFWRGLLVGFLSAFPLALLALAGDLLGLV